MSKRKKAYHFTVKVVTHGTKAEAIDNIRKGCFPEDIRRVETFVPHSVINLIQRLHKKKDTAWKWTRATFNMCDG